MDQETQTEVLQENGAEPAGAMVEVAKSRVAQEIQAKMIVAKRFPRDQNAAYARIMESCKRQSLAKQATYTYPRGGQSVTGPSIRLAEVLAQNWGNLECGIVEVEQRPGESVMMAFAWDLETNYHQTKTFTVPHVRWTKKFGATRARDPRDIYEITANQGARRMRACVLGVIPGDIVEAAVERCNKTLTEGHTEPLADRIRKMTSAFHEMGVSKEMIERRLGHKLSTTTEQELVNLFGVYRAIKDNMQPAHAYFDQPEEEQAKPTSDRVRDAVRQKAEAARETKNGGETEAAPQGAQGPDSAPQGGGNGDPDPNDPFITRGKVGRVWRVAKARAKELGHSEEEAEGIVRMVLETHGIEADPEKPDEGPSVSRIPWKGDTYQTICDEIKNWTPPEQAGTEEDQPEAAEDEQLF